MNLAGSVTKLESKRSSFAVEDVSDDESSAFRDDGARVGSTHAPVASADEGDFDCSRSVIRAVFRADSG